MKEVNKSMDDFGLPEQVIQQSVQIHKREPTSPLQERRTGIIALAREQRQRKIPWYGLMLAAAAIFIGVLYFPTTQMTTPAASQANIDREIEIWLGHQYAIAEEPLENLIYSDSDGILNWNFIQTMDLSEEELDILIQEWTVEMTDHEIYNLKNI